MSKTRRSISHTDAGTISTLLFMMRIVFNAGSLESSSGMSVILLRFMSRYSSFDSTDKSFGSVILDNLFSSSSSCCDIIWICLVNTIN